MNTTEKIIADALTKASLEFVMENDMMNAAGLDFYLPQYDIYIEVKSFYSERIAEQMSRAKNVIAIQGEQSARVFADMVCGYFVIEK